MTTALGFLVIRQHAEHGYFGGYLLVNQLARPLEFHCTLPVKPSRAQMLLYGPTIDDFVCGEQIAKALITKAKITPQLVLTDTVAALAVTLVSSIRIAHLASDERQERPEQCLLNMPQHSCLGTREVKVIEHRLTLAQESHTTTEDLQQALSAIDKRFDLNEPFSRILEALVEAHPIVKSAA